MDNTQRHVPKGTKWRIYVAENGVLGSFSCKIDKKSCECVSVLCVLLNRCEITAVRKAARCRKNGGKMNYPRKNGNTTVTKGVIP